MLSAFRNLSKSKIGTAIMAAVGLVILASFALSDVSGVKNGSFGFSRDTLAKAGDEEVTERDLGSQMRRMLAQLRQQKADATYADLAKDLPAIIDQLVDQMTIRAFAADHGFVLSKRLVDAEIAKLPQTKGLDGKFSQAAYSAFLAEQQMTDADFRRMLVNALTQRQVLAPAAVGAKVPMGVTRPYASMYLEERKGEIALIVNESFRAGLNPTDGDLQAYYQQNAKRYLIPEQRVLRFATINAATVPGATPTDKEIADYYNANQAIYGASQKRVISQAVVQDKAAADAIAARARAGSFVDAVKPAGLSAEDVSVGPQTKEDFTKLAGDQVAAAAFAAAKGAIVGPVRSDLGWHVIRIDDVQATGGKPLASVRAEISAKLAESKRQGVIGDAVNDIEDAIDGGANFQEAVAKAKLPIVTTPAIGANGASLTDPAYKLPGEYASALAVGFGMENGADPEIVSLPDKSGYVLVGLDRVIAAAPPPFASIKDRIRADWIEKKASDRARAVAAEIAAKVAKGTPLAQAVADAKAGLPPVQQVDARRIQLEQANADAAAPLKMLFALGKGNSRMVADPQGRGFFVVKTNEIIPHDASTNVMLIAQTQGRMQQSTPEELAVQFVGAMRKDQKVKRNDAALAAAKERYSQAN